MHVFLSDISFVTTLATYHQKNRAKEKRGDKIIDLAVSFRPNFDHFCECSFFCLVNIYMDLVVLPNLSLSFLVLIFATDYHIVNNVISGRLSSVFVPTRRPVSFLPAFFRLTSAQWNLSRIRQVMNMVFF